MTEILFALTESIRAPGTDGAKHLVWSGARSWSLRVATALICAACTSCGTTKWTDTARTATEQLLITDSIDRAVSRLDLRALAGKKVYVDDSPAKSVTDSAYLASAIRQHVLANGAILKTNRDEADYILEVRAGAIGTDRHDLLFGVPATNLPTFGIPPGAPTQIPEIALAKKTDQRGVAKISLFAYNKQTGRPVWQSGAVPEESTTKALWVLGAGPFQRGTIHRGTTFAGAKLNIPLINPMWSDDGEHTPVAVADEAFFVEPTDHANEAKSEDKPSSPTSAQAAPKLPAAPATVAGGAPTPVPNASGAIFPGSIPQAETSPSKEPPRSNVFNSFVPSNSTPVAKSLDLGETWRDPIR